MPAIRQFLLLLIVISLTPGCATIRKFNPIESGTLEARRLTQQAEAAIHQQEWNQAEQKLVRAIEKNPDDTRARDVLANVLWERGAKRAAIEQKSHSINLSGRRDPVALTELGQMELSNAGLDAALRYADEAIRQDSNHADAWTLRGFVLREQGNYDPALSAFFRSLSIRSDDPRTRLEIAKIYRETGQSRRALAILGTAPKEEIVACPHFPEACYLRGVLMRDLDRPSDAVAALQAARANGCEVPDLLLQLADAQLAAGDHLQARATAEMATEKIASVGLTAEYEVALRDLRQRVETLGADLVPNEAAPMWR